ncbi:hypothetical protein FB45DRAFT_1037784 [Roridomyces roridus]|uniref:Uncharacterized protein n=1 Tax=Roridomyces roridus TaxID=1738132 RepID=A0AAD7B4Y3_9AGAR|nr:hypothetical protein FB45DRAFT_1037784 [Roridomyces roridus]
MTIAHDGSQDVDDPSTIIHSVWEWMEKTGALADEEDKLKLLKLILEASLVRVRHQLQEGSDLILSAKESDLTELERDYLEAIRRLYADLIDEMGPQVPNPDLLASCRTFISRTKAYQTAKEKLNKFLWLRLIERQIGEASLLKLVDELKTPCDQWVTIMHAAGTAPVRAILSAPLQIEVLPVPVPTSAFRSTPAFETRVRSYLRTALHSYAANAWENKHVLPAIDSAWKRIQRGNLPPFLSPHPEMTLLSHHLNLYLHPTTPGLAPYPYFGLSDLSCFHCVLYFQAYRDSKVGPVFETRGSHDIVTPCGLPPIDNPAIQAIEKEMAAKIQRVFGQILAKMSEDQYTWSLLDRTSF